MSRLCAVARLAGLRAKHFSKKSARGFAWADGVLYLVDRTCTGRGVFSGWDQLAGVSAGA